MNLIRCSRAIFCFVVLAASNCFALTFVEQAKIDAEADRDGLDLFGTSVAIDGDTAVVGCPFEGSGDATDMGAAYVFVRSGGTWSRQTKLTSNEAQANDRFGTAVAINGDTIVVGAPRKNNDLGAAYAYVRSGTTWTFQAKLVPQTPSAQQFGASLALSDDRVFVGAPFNSTGDFVEHGVVIEFSTDGTNWFEGQTIEASDRDDNDHFGESVALDSNTLVVGAPRRDAIGAAYVYVQGKGWSEQAILEQSNGTNGDNLGAAVAIEGNTVIVGAPTWTDSNDSTIGAAFVFTRSGNTWTEQKRLNAGDAGQTGGRFGAAVAIQGTTVLVGAPANDIGETDEGEVYVFSGSGANWIEESDFAASDAASDDRFGSCISFSGTTALVGCPFKDEAQGPENCLTPGNDQGAAYVFIVGGGGPVTSDLSLTVYEDSPVHHILTAINETGGALTFSIVAQPQHGTVTIENAATGDYNYFPALNYAGSDEFTFKANNGSGDSNTAKVSITIIPVNDAPVFDSVFIKTPITPAIFVPVSFSAFVSDADGDTLTVSWTFGDGGTGSGANVVHTYDTPGLYDVTVTASDGNGGTASQTVKVEVVLPPLIVDKMSVKINFAKDGSDSLAFSGSVLIPDGFTFPGKPFRILAGGIDRTITLDAKGKSPKGNDKITFGKPKNSRSKYSVKFSKGTFAAALLGEGYTNTNEKNKRVFVTVILIFGGSAYGKNQPQLYSSKLGKGGASK